MPAALRFAGYYLKKRYCPAAEFITRLYASTVPMPVAKSSRWLLRRPAPVPYSKAKARRLEFPSIARAGSGRRCSSPGRRS